MVLGASPNKRKTKMDIYILLVRRVSTLVDETADFIHQMNQADELDLIKDDIYRTLASHCSSHFSARQAEFERKIEREFAHDDLLDQLN